MVVHQKISELFTQRGLRWYTKTMSASLHSLEVLVSRTAGLPSWAIDFQISAVARYPLKVAGIALVAASVGPESPFTVEDDKLHLYGAGFGVVESCTSPDLIQESVAQAVFQLVQPEDDASFTSRVSANCLPKPFDYGFYGEGPRACARKRA
jgi:hypothetical protein